MRGPFLLAGSIAFHGATLIDGTGAPPRRGALLVVSDGRIVSVGDATPEALRALPAETRTVALSGQWIVPGLIDAHVHAEGPEDLRQMLRWGVTSARLMAEDVASARDLASDSRTRLDVPDLFPAAPIFTTRGGWWEEAPAGAVDRFPASVEGARRAVEKAARLGTAEIKLMFDDMRWCRDPRPPLQRMPEAVAGTLIETAAKRGLRSIVHAPQLPDARRAVARGAGALAHGVLERLDAETIATMARRPVFYIPTMGIFEFLADTARFVDSILADPRAVRGLPAETVKRYRSPAYSSGYREKYPGFGRVAAALPALRANLVALHAAGVPVAMGTDMWAFPGLGASAEIDLYVRAGLPPLAAIRSATQTAARSLGLSDRGALTPGQRADFLVLAESPLEDARNLRAIEAVFKGGRETPR
ncbi:MAG: amidohydrolase family protein [Thermoanaerobaculia bacterium]